MNNLEATEIEMAGGGAFSDTAESKSSDKIQALLTNPDFLKLKRILNKTTANLFSTLAVSHRERWHSAFIKWIIDPKSNIGLGDFPVKRFFHLVLKHYSIGNGGEPPDLTFGDVESMELVSSKFNNEEEIKVEGEADLRRIDVYGEIQTCFVGNERENLKKTQIIIENKVEAIEGNNQTEAYAAWAKSDRNKFKPDFLFLIFLSPTNHGEKLTSNKFVKITYQHLVDDVLLPCLQHPDLNQEGKYWLEQYLLNLGMPLKNKKTMAKTNKEICKRIYDVHKTVLDEIFSSVNDGKLPESESENQSKQHFDISLQNLVERKLLSLTDALHGDYNGKHYTASLIQNDDSVGIVCGGIEYDTPSAAGSAVRDNKATNGWAFWEIKDSSGKSKGKLSEIREQFLNS